MIKCQSYLLAYKNSKQSKHILPISHGQGIEGKNTRKIREKVLERNHRNSENRDITGHIDILKNCTMGTCLAVIKVTGVVSLGIYAGVVSTNVLNSSDIFKFVLTKTTNSSNLNAVTEYVQGKVKSNGILLGVLGAVSTTAFQLAYFGAPLKSQHPYLIYSSLVFPITSLIYYYFSKDSLVKLFNIDSLIKFTKGEKKVAISDLDNSVYKDLGEDSSEQAEDDEIAEEVEYHLNQKTATEAVESLSVSSKLSAGVSLLGFVIASVGIYGDF